MKKLAYKPGTLLAAMFLITSAIAAQEVSREFNKEFIVTGNSSLEIDNKYGDITVEASQSDKVIIYVKATVRYPNQERAERLLSYIDVRFSQEGDKAAARTVIDDKFTFTGWGGDSRKFTIDYLVKMPASLSFTVSNRYGNTELDDLTGLVTIDVKYGNLTAGRLSRGNEKPMSEVSIAHGKATIEEAGWLNVILRYSGNFTLSKSQALLVDSKYSTLNLGTVSSIVGESRYDGRFRIENINNLVIDQGYSNITVGKLAKKLSIDASYGSFNADVIESGFESIDVDTRYASVRLGIEEPASYNLDAKMSYGGLKYNEENFVNKRRIIENTSTELSGIVGKEESPKANVTIKGSYATVKLY
jgi:hypothetical protein